MSFGTLQRGPFVDVARGGRHAIEVVQAHGRGAAEAVVGAENDVAELYWAQTEGEADGRRTVRYAVPLKKLLFGARLELTARHQKNEQP